MRAAEPDPPSNARVHDVTRNSARLTWAAPSDDGGSALRGYVVEGRTPYNPRWVKLTRAPVRETEYVCTDLGEGEEYEFRVVAVNDVGSSKPSSATPSTKIKNPIGRPAMFFLSFILFFNFPSVKYLCIKYVGNI